jgi:hypothetical protein
MQTSSSPMKIASDGNCKQIHEIEVSWPFIRVHHSRVDGDVHRIFEWTHEEVYGWFRLKKLPVTGFVNLQLSGQQLVHLYLSAGLSVQYALRMNDTQMMMSFICSCRNKKEEPSSIYTLRKVRTIRGCLEGLTLMI